jgi:hypothetical protein
MAVRLSKPVLAMSGLRDEVQLDVKQGQITLRAVRPTRQNPRAGWRQKIEQELKTRGPLSTVDDYGDLVAELEATVGDGLDTL